MPGVRQNCCGSKPKSYEVQHRDVFCWLQLCYLLIESNTLGDKGCIALAEAMKQSDSCKIEELYLSIARNYGLSALSQRAAYWPGVRSGALPLPAIVRPDGIHPCDDVANRADGCRAGATAAEDS